MNPSSKFGRVRDAGKGVCYTRAMKILSQHVGPVFGCFFPVLIGLFVSIFHSAAAWAQPRELVIQHLSDIHGVIASQRVDQGVECGGMARLATALSRSRQETRDRKATSLFLCSGDMFQGTTVVDGTRGACMIDLFNQLGLVAACVGNHEFDYGADALTQRLTEARFKVITANVRCPDPVGRLWKPYHVVEQDGLRIGLVGATAPRTVAEDADQGSRVFEFLDPETSLRSAVRNLKKEGVSLVVALTHTGVDVDRKLAERIEGLDLILGGHTHTRLRNPEKIGRSILVHSGEHGRFMSEVRLSVEPGVGCRLLGFRQIALCGPDVPVDPKLEASVDRYMSIDRKLSSKVIGEISVDLPRGLRGDFSPISSLVAEAMRSYYRVPIAVVTVGGQRRALSRGPVTVGDVYEVNPFDNQLVTMEVEGRALRSAIERAIGGAWVAYDQGKIGELSRQLAGRRLISGFEPAPRKIGFVQCSGLSFTFDPRKKDGQRLVDIRAGTAPLVDSRTYRIVLSSFLAAGGDGMSEFKKGKNRVRHPEKDRQILEIYLQKCGRLTGVPSDTVKNLANEFARLPVKR